MTESAVAERAQRVEAHPVDVMSAPTEATAETATAALRRGLPRVAGGDPWPPAAAVVAALADAAPSTVEPPAAEHPVAEPAAAGRPSARSARSGTDAIAASAGVAVALRRGLPRTAGADPWPPAGEALDRWAPVAPTVEAAPAAVEMTPAAETTPLIAAEPVISASVVGPREPRRLFGIRIGVLALWAIGLVALASCAVLGAQWFRAQPFGQDFIGTYPGETHLRDGAPVGFPAWLGWQHFFNVFLMVLIIRSGLQVRREKRPTAFWTPRWNAKRKISLALWLHQSLDILWLLNGVIFVILMFVTGQWMRVIPTDWGVFPNAVSAMIQYLSLTWPTENGWVNYNSLQVLAYFTTIFIAAPLAAITGVRMSGIWPKNATRLSKAYPVEWARAVHFPVMLYFCAFILVHVALVLSTGALRNLNHMYAGQDAVNWWGFAIFILSLLVIAGGWLAARPIVLAPIAGLFGTVKGR